MLSSLSSYWSMLSSLLCSRAWVLETQASTHSVTRVLGATDSEMEHMGHQLEMHQRTSCTSTWGAPDAPAPAAAW